MLLNIAFASSGRTILRHRIGSKCAHIYLGSTYMVIVPDRSCTETPLAGIIPRMILGVGGSLEEGVWFGTKPD